MKKFLKKKYTTILVIILILLSILTGYYSYKLRQTYQNTLNNEYNESFSEAVNLINNVENFLAKAMISKDSRIAAENLSQIWKEANLAMVYLSRIPFDSENQSQTIKFLNQVSDYSYALSRKNINNKELTDEDFKNLETLTNYCMELQGTLNQLQEELYSGQVSWNNLNKESNNLNFAQEVDNVSPFTSIESNFSEYEGLIYDGAYSEHITSKEKKGLTGEEINEEKAKEIAESFVGKDNIKEIKNSGLSENGTIKSYSFEITTNNNDNMTIAISQKGGHIVFMNHNRDIIDEKLSEDEAHNRAIEFLNSKGYTNMKKTYSLKEYGIITINYAYEENDVIVYPDLIKVKVALDNGEILGIETTGYLNNHEKRNIDKSNIISKEEAKKLSNENLKIEETRLAIIPTEFETEVFCWELKGTVENREFLLYVNAKTGKVEDILVIIQTEDGTLTQ